MPRLSTRIGPDSPADAHPETYWDGRGKVQGSATLQRVSPAIPAGLVGEFLPPLRPTEVEIVMIGMRTTMGDVTSVRARRRGVRILYDVVDEYSSDGNRHTFKPKSSSRPLTFKQVADLLWSIEVADYGQLFQQTWLEQSESDFKNYGNDFFFLKSDFYDGLDEWLDKQFVDWKERHPDGRWPRSRSGPSRASNRT